jgi:hypothetical protein
MRIWPRRKLESPPPPVVLPSLDRLAGLIERVVELVDEVSGTPAAPPPERPATERTPPTPPALPPASEPTPEPAPQPTGAAEPAVDGAWFAFLPSPQGYQLVDLPGTLPAPGAELAVDGVRYRVLRDAPSPLPGDRRRCVVLEMEEPPEPARTPDA